MMINNSVKIKAINEELERHLLDYLNSTVDGAFMINGEWGCGKTYFIKDFIYKYKETINNNVDIHSKYLNEEKIEIKNDNDQKFKIAYVSLNGLKSIDEINNAIFASVHPCMYKFKNSLAYTLIAKGINDKIGFQLIKKDKDFKNNQNINVDLLVFDDFERCLINIPELFGYLNMLMEESKLKLIVITNEKEIKNYTYNEDLNLKKLISSNLISDDCKMKFNENSSNVTLGKKEVKNNIKSSLEDVFNNVFGISYYDVIKEKTIYKTYNYKFNSNILFDNIIPSIESISDEIKKYLIEQKELINEIIRIMNCNNLRTCISAIYYFNSLIKYLVEENRILKNTSDNGNYDYQKRLIDDLVVSIFYYEILYREPKKENENDYIYDTLTINTHRYYLFKSIKNDIKTDFINKEILKYIDQYIYDNNLDEGKRLPECMAYLNSDWTSYEDSQIRNYISQMRQLFNDDKIPFIYFMKYYEYLFLYNKFGFDQIDLNEELKKIKNRISLNFDPKFYNSEYIDAQYHFLDGHYPDLDNSIIEILDTINDENIKQKNNELKNFFINPVDKFNKMKEISDIALSNKKFLSNFTVDYLYNLIIRSSNNQIKELRLIIGSVYNFDNIRDFYESDKEVIKQLILKLDAYNDESIMKKVSIQRLNTYLKNILGKL